MKKCDIGDCTHEGWWMCTRCTFTICGDHHDDNFPVNPDEGDGKDYCPVCAEYHNDWFELAYILRALK
ncbi:hypothetical protein LCGC14_0728870 [marine sediment metagenome]|uniref:Uncharacterized protein n=1 Tax=marine sediment metagenome TaxID=412755 RepID=A0A0F9QA85_9ZZZZ